MSNSYILEEAVLLSGLNPEMACVGELGDVDFIDADDINMYLPADWIEGSPPPGTEANVPPGFVAPGAVKVRPERWRLETSPADYLVAAGDTLVGLAATYLGAGARWKEIWALNSGRLPSPDKLIADQDYLLMPDEARDNLIDWLELGKPATKPGDIHKPGVEIVGGNTGGGGRWSTGAKVAAGGAGALAVLGLLYAATR